MATQSVRALAERANRLEASKKRQRAESRMFEAKITGALAAAGGAATAGFLDGRFDVTKFDQNEGDGLRLMGMPAMGVLSAALVGGGLYMGGKVGHWLMNAGVGTGCGLLYTKSLQAGVESAAKAA